MLILLYTFCILKQILRYSSGIMQYGLCTLQEKSFVRGWLNSVKNIIKVNEMEWCTMLCLKISNINFHMYNAMVHIITPNFIALDMGIQTYEWIILCHKPNIHNLMVIIFLDGMNFILTLWTELKDPIDVNEGEFVLWKLKSWIELKMKFNR